MAEDNEIMFSLGAFLVVIRGKYRIVLPNNAGNLKKSVTKIFGAFL